MHTFSLGFSSNWSGWVWVGLGWLMVAAGVLALTVIIVRAVLAREHRRQLIEDLAIDELHQVNEGLKSLAGSMGNMSERVQLIEERLAKIDGALQGALSRLEKLEGQRCALDHSK